MADYYPVLKRAISSLPSSSGDARRLVYEKARAALLKQLQSYDPPLSPAEITEQRLALEECIRRIESEVAGAAYGLSPPPETPDGPPPPPAPPPGQTAAERLRAADRSAGPVAPAGQRPEAEPRPEPPRAEAPPRPEPKPVPPLRIEPKAAPEPAREGRSPSLAPPVAAVKAPPLAAEPRRQPAEPPQPAKPGPQSEPRIGAGISALSNTLRQADDLGGASAKAVRSARDAIEDEAPPAEKAPAAEEKIEPSFLDEPLGGQPPPPPSTSAADAARVSGARPRRPQPAPRPGAAKAPPSGGEKRSRAVPIATVIVLLAVLGVGAVGWMQRERIDAWLSGSTETATLVETPAEEPPPVDDGLEPKIPDRLPQEGEPANAVAPDARAVETVQVQPTPELDLPPGAVLRTVPPPPSGEAPVAAAEDPQPVAPEPDAPAATPDPAPPAVAALDPASGGDPGIMVEQRAILYEEPIPGSDGARTDGRAVWSLVEEPVLPGEPPVPQIRARVEVPDRGMTLVLSIRENSDPSLPASHIVEARFEVPPDFSGRTIDTTPGLIMKEREDDRGDPLAGAVAKVSENLFWLALSGSEQDRARNLSLVEERQWIDVPIRYGNRRRAILTFEKGAPGDRVFEQALAAWAE